MPPVNCRTDVTVAPGATDCATQRSAPSEGGPSRRPLELGDSDLMVSRYSAKSTMSLVAIRVRLEGTFDRHADVIGLLFGERGQFHPERVKVQSRHLLVEVLGQYVDLFLVVRVVHEQLDLGHGLVREGVAHHEARVSGRVAEVEKSSFG